MAIHVNIVSAEGAIFEGDADMVFAPAKAGELGIAPRHAPLITTLVDGTGLIIYFEIARVALGL